eukprot:6077669-Prymnesium_polylepis.1
MPAPGGDSADTAADAEACERSVTGGPVRQWSRRRRGVEDSQGLRRTRQVGVWRCAGVGERSATSRAARTLRRRAHANDQVILADGALFWKRHGSLAHFARPPAAAGLRRDLSARARLDGHDAVRPTGNTPPVVQLYCSRSARNPDKFMVAADATVRAVHSRQTA